MVRIDGFMTRIVFLFVFLCDVSAIAQQDKLITHFIYDKMSVNPGETGIDEGICATSVYRNQWDRVNGAPNSALFNVSANLTRFFPGGVGLAFYHDAIGFNRQNNVLFNYSYPLEIGDAGVLGVGLGVGITNFGMDPAWVPPTTNPDNFLPEKWKATNMDMSFGLYFKGVSGFYFGISSTHLTQSLLKQNTASAQQSFQTVRHYYLMGGKKIHNIAGGDIDIQTLLRTEFIKLSGDINVRYLWRNKFYGGLTYRNVDALALMLGCMPVQNMTVGYSYDLTTNKIASVSRGSHELLLKYCFYLPTPPPTRANHPRWL
jgi:type IX secretion system PorP/SprF family membrane protein